MDRLCRARGGGYAPLLIEAEQERRPKVRPFLCSGIGWIRTNGHPVNNRPLNQAELRSQIPVCCHTGSGRGAAPSHAFVVAYARAKSAITGGVDVSKPTTSIMPASSGSATLNPVDVIPTTTSLAGMPRAS